MQRLIDTQNRILRQADTSIKRYLYKQINWKNRLIAITGQRGTGKTTILIQRIKEAENSNEYLYISADSLFIYKLSLFEIALNFRNNGGKYLFIDEIHKYPSWSGEIKHIYDAIPDLNIVFTGSSILDIMKGYADLSRRAIHYTLQGLSFREYLLFETKVDFPTFTLDEIIHQKVTINLDKPLFHFNNYLKKGFYPFYKEEDFELKLMSVINTVLEVDLVQYLDLKPSTIAKLKKLLQIISESVPFKPNISKIADLTSISRSLLPEYFNYLERAGLITMLPSHTKGIQALGKPEKMYLSNTNLCHILVGNDNANIGNVRETFFASQLTSLHTLSIPKKGDFLVKELTFEIGGKNKTKSQIVDITNSYLVKDDIEVGYQNTIPLWHFGFVY
ncbi:MAG: ATP-binding protein [Flavobacteriales bacterium]|nr:ATP-binding protein [Flavobacteriales bacterium]